MSPLSLSSPPHGSTLSQMGNSNGPWLTEASLQYINDTGHMTVNFSTQPQGNFMLRAISPELKTLTGIEVPLPDNTDLLPSLQATGGDEG